MAKYFHLDDHTRSLGVALTAARGTGKSRLIGRLLLAQDALRGIPTIVIDPGETINNFLSKVSEFPPHVQRELTSRVIYIDMAGRDGYISPFPLYYKFHNESAYRVAQRPIDLIRHADPALLAAPIHGFNPTYLIGTHAGIILSSLGYQITELEHLLMHPEAWEGRLQELERIASEARESVAFFRNEYTKWSKDRRIARSEALRIKAATFTLDPETKGIFGANIPALNLSEVIAKKQTILIDISGVTDIERRRFMMMHLLSYITNFVKARGPGHHHTPLSVVIDEFSMLTNFQDEAFAQELDELISVISRSHRLWITLCSQSLGQYNEAMQRVLLSLGTQIIGQQDMESAEKIAKSFFSLDPKAVKHYHPVYFGTQDVNHGIPSGPRSTFYPRVAEVIDTRPEFYSLPESEYIAAKRLRELKRFTFMIRPAIEEGTVSSALFPISIARFDKDVWIDMQLVEEAKRKLRKRDGLPVGPILAEIASRTPKLLPITTPHATLSAHEKKRPTLPPADPDEDVS